MKTYIVDDRPVSIGAGTALELTPAQLAVRGHLVTVVRPAAEEGGRSVVTADQPLQFKRGETVTFDGEPPKGMAAAVPDITTLKPAEIGAIKTRARNQRPSKPTADKSPAKKLRRASR